MWENDFFECIFYKKGHLALHRDVWYIYSNWWSNWKRERLRTSAPTEAYLIIWKFQGFLLRYYIEITFMKNTRNNDITIINSESITHICYKYYLQLTKFKTYAYHSLKFILKNSSSQQHKIEMFNVQFWVHKSKF